MCRDIVECVRKALCWSGMVRRDIVEYVRKALCWSGIVCRDIVEYVRKALCWSGIVRRDIVECVRKAINQNPFVAMFDHVFLSVQLQGILYCRLSQSEDHLVI